MLEKAQKKQLNMLTTKLMQTLSSLFTKMVASYFEITKGSCKRAQAVQVGQGSSKKTKTYVKCQKEDESKSSDVENTCHLIRKS